ncbi:MAG: hypothetical protein AB7F91_09530 [Parvularculaceae bacterium]
MPGKSMLAGAIGAAFIASASLAADYRAEATKIVSEIETLHPRGREIAESERFMHARDGLMAIAGDTDVAHYAVALGRMFATAEDGHTNALGFYSDLPEFAWRYPIEIKRFDDGLYVVAAKEEGSILLGRRIVSVNGEPVDAFVRRFAETMGYDNPAWPANWAPHALMRPGWLIGLDVASPDFAAPVEFVAVDKRGRKAKAQLRARQDGREGLTRIAAGAPALQPDREGHENYVNRLAGGKALAVVIGAMEDEEDKTFEAFTREVIAAMEDPAVERLIVDLRNNGGGNNLLTEPLRRMIVKSRFNRPGGVYVLTAPQTFSAAMNFATRLERETDALFVGEPTGGAPNHFGDPKFASGEASTLPYIISTLRWQDSPPLDPRRRILPDIPVAPTFADFVAGKDRALCAALAHEPDADMIEKWWLRAMQPWERASQKADWKFFFETR